MPHAVRSGKKERQSFSKIEAVQPMPNLIAIQKDSYDWFIKEGLAEVFEDISPIYTFYAAVARKHLDGTPAEGFQMENALTREQALRSITIWVAKGCFLEGRKGSIEVGKDADFVILDRDLMTVAENEIPLANVKMCHIH